MIDNLPPLLIADFGSTQAGVLSLDREGHSLDPKRKLPNLPKVLATTIGRSFKARVLASIEDVVAGHPRDLEPPTQLGDLLAFKQASHETTTLIHLATLPPWHLRVSRKFRKVPM